MVSFKTIALTLPFCTVAIPVNEDGTIPAEKINQIADTLMRALQNPESSTGSTGNEDDSEVNTFSGVDRDVDENDETLSIKFDIPGMSVEDHLTSGGEKRWTEASRPWTTLYSQFRRTYKDIVHKTILLDPKLSAAMGPDEIKDDGEETRYPAGINELPKLIKQYGCWCMARGDRDFSNGHGSGVDAVDNICKSLGQCLACSQLHHQCFEIEDTRYSHQVEAKKDAYGKTVGYELVCNDNPDSGEFDCLKEACECHKFFVSQFSELALKAFNEDFNNKFAADKWFIENGNFLNPSGMIDPAFSQKSKRYSGSFVFEDCKAGRLRAHQDLVLHTPAPTCCGKHPTWHTYDNRNGEKVCVASTKKSTGETKYHVMERDEARDQGLLEDDIL